MSDISTDGIIGQYSGDDFTVKAIFTTFLGIALYNSIELLVLIFVSFRRYRGLYFWSLLLSTAVGVVPQSLSFILKYYNIGPLWFSITLSTIGWYFMVTGQALVLFSRLNLVVQDVAVNRRVLAMIITDAIVLHIPTTVFTYGSNFIRTALWVRGYKVMERIELTGFCLQEFIISGLYILKTIRILRNLFPSGHSPNPKRKIMYQLLSINSLIILLDTLLLVFEYLNYFVIQTTLKSIVYSIKLKLEFGVLSRLVFLVQSNCYQPRESDTHRRRAESWPDHHDFPDFSQDSLDYQFTTARRKLPSYHI